MTAPPRISVVIPCYNAETWVARAIQSVLDQPGVEAEVIVIDDGSTDGSLEVIRGFGERIRHETGPNRGGCAARNRGLELATAEYVMFLDADDYLEGPLLQGLVQRLEETQADLAVGPCANASETRAPAPRPAPRTDSCEDLMVDWLTGKWLPPCALAWRRSRVAEIGGWRPELPNNQDGELVLRAALRGIKLARSDAGRAVYWHHASPTRISNRISEHGARNNLSILRDLVGELQPRLAARPDLRWALSCVSHTLERGAAFRGMRSSVDEIRAFRRSLGFPRYHGSTAHVIASRLLGLGRKERLSRWLHAKRRRLFDSRPS